jgi:ribosomal protein S18 acetylase RimI-like enzyme
MIEINFLQSTDVLACVRIMLANPLWARYGVTAAGAEKMFTRALSENATILVAQLDGEVAGFNWYVTRGAWDRSGYIRLIGVSPDHQGKGVGEELMKAAEERMAEQVSDVFLLVSDFNSGAQRFYTRLGYTQVGAIPDYVLAGIAELIFFKPLKREKGL